MFSRYFSYVPDFDDRGKVSDKDGDGDVDLKDMAIYGMDRLSTEDQPSEKHDEAVKRIEELAIRFGCFYFLLCLSVVVVRRAPVRINNSFSPLFSYSMCYQHVQTKQCRNDEAG